MPIPDFAHVPKPPAEDTFVATLPLVDIGFGGDDSEAPVVEGIVIDAEDSVLLVNSVLELLIVVVLEWKVPEN
jgi:hypothetical protein